VSVPGQDPQLDLAAVAHMGMSALGISPIGLLDRTRRLYFGVPRAAESSIPLVDPAVPFGVDRERIGGGVKDLGGLVVTSPPLDSCSWSWPPTRANDPSNAGRSELETDPDRVDRDHRAGDLPQLGCLRQQGCRVVQRVGIFERRWGSTPTGGTVRKWATTQSRGLAAAPDGTTARGTTSCARDRTLEFGRNESTLWLEGRQTRPA
jgi:hypothetical protein